jgi:hypothetical protein
MSPSSLLVLLHGALLYRGSMLQLAPHLPERHLLLGPIWPAMANDDPRANPWVP